MQSRERERELDRKEQVERKREGARSREKEDEESRIEWRDREEVNWKTIPLNSEMQTEELHYNAKLIIEKGSLWL